MNQQGETMNVRQLTALDATVRPACQRCGHRDRRGLANMRGVKLCSVCSLVAIAKCRLARGR